MFTEMLHITSNFISPKNIYGQGALFLSHSAMIFKNACSLFVCSLPSLLVCLFAAFFACLFVSLREKVFLYYFTEEKRNVDCMTEKLYILKVSQYLSCICYRWPRNVNWSQLKWDHFEILAKGRSDTHCKIKETLLIQELKPTLKE